MLKNKKLLSKNPINLYGKGVPYSKTIFFYWGNMLIFLSETSIQLLLLRLDNQSICEWVQVIEITIKSTRAIDFILV